VYDRHGEYLGVVAGKDGYRHIPLLQLPPNLVRCILVAEDRHFYSHGGVDAVAVGRAAWMRLRGRSRSGASTITMQLAKLCNPPAPRSYRTKVREALQARRLEYAYSKDELLLAYLNRADFGNQCRGAETAAQFYFGKSAHELELPEAALLAAMVQAPTRLNPLQNPRAALRSRNRILHHLGASTDAPLGVLAHSLSPTTVRHCSPGTLTQDATLHRSVAHIALQELQLLHGHNAGQAAVVVIDNRSSELLVALPAANPSNQHGGQINGLRTPRSAGSTLKPFVYLQAFAHGAWPGTIMADVPTQYQDSGGIQAPGNYNDRYLGPISIRRALACSQNIPAMDALSYYGGEERLLSMLRALGMSISGNAQEYGLGLAIGNAHVTLLQLAHAYSTLARGGELSPLHTHLPHAQPEPQRVLDARHCYQIAHILSDAAARTPTFGEAPHLNFPFPCAVKTGTSSNYRDNWCVGFTAEYTVGVWVGNFDNSPMRNISGVSGAGPIFHRVMSLLYENGQQAGFPTRPEGLQEMQIDSRSGTPATPSTPKACLATELGTAEQLAALPTAQVDERGRVILNSRYAEWYATCSFKRLYTLDAASDSGRRLAILIPSHGTTVHLDPTLPHNGSIIELRSTSTAAGTTWSCPTLHLYTQGGKTYAKLTPGKHTLRVTSPHGKNAEATFTVVQD
jgi:penicillin-binding protein 1C